MVATGMVVMAHLENMPIRIQSLSAGAGNEALKLLTFRVVPGFAGISVRAAKT
jgi:hypothetical protein